MMPETNGKSLEELEQELLSEPDLKLSVKNTSL